MLFECKHSGTGQNKINLPSILFCKGTNSPAVSWADNWTLSSFFVPDGSKTKMGHG